MSSTKKVVYIAGPMDGKPLFNFLEFLRAIPLVAEHHVKVYGIVPKIINPAYHDLELGFNPYLSFEDQDSEFNYEAFMAKALHKIREEVTDIYLLPDWNDSSGARRELKAALTAGADVWSIYRGHHSSGLWVADGATGTNLV